MIKNKDNIPIWSEKDFDGMRKAGKLAAETLDYITDFVKEGISTLELNDLCAKFIKDNGAIAAPLNYNGYPKEVCISLNNVICHGIPDEKTVLKDGDILNIDVTVILNGWYGDTSRMFTVGKTSVRAQKLIDKTYEALMAAINAVRPGMKLYEVGEIIEQVTKPYNFSIVRDFCGHGLGKEFHTQPMVLHYKSKLHNNITLEEGMFFTIEPMINAGKYDAKILSDGWTAVTKDRSLSAQFEHSIGVTKDGVEIFTSSPKGLDKPPYK
ncbi:MAG: type I methionyl aminopeptidase [Alphaproteobacteria bacterium]|jgi:methionyl aminopeptidase|nr:type I methionyl aminopeptidase [Alphaproteobacteria bacterium]MCV6599120.1 type I methionyl aminopeptidase [Alphaproteobacteria bacterium]